MGQSFSAPLLSPKCLQSAFVQSFACFLRRPQEIHLLTQQPSKRSAKIQEMLTRLEQEADPRAQIDLLNDLSASVSSTDPKRARAYANEALELATSFNYERGIAFSYQSLAQVHFCVSEFDQAIEDCREALARFLTLELAQAAARTHLILASVHLRQSKQSKGMEETLKAIELSESCGDLQGVAIGKNLLGILYGDQQQNDLALVHLQASAEIHKKIGDRYRFAMAQINLGNLYNRQGDPAAAAPFYELAAEMLEEIEPDGYPIATLFFDLGEMWRELGNLAKSEGFHRKSLGLRRSQGNETGVAASLNGMGRLYSFRGEVEKAREAFEEALSISQRVGIPKEKWQAGVGLAETEEAAGDYPLALRRQKEAAKYHEDLLDALQQDRIARIKAEFESETKEREAQLYQLENVRLKEEVERRKKAEAALVQAQKLESLGLMAGGLAHDFNNMLLCVFGYNELARNSLPEDHPAISFLHLADSTAKRACSLAEQMLTYSGGREYELSPCDLRRFFEDNLNLLQAAVGKQTEIVWKETHLATSIQIHAEEAQLFQVWMNLALNGKEAGASRIEFSYGLLEMGKGDSSHLNFTGTSLSAGVYAVVRVQDNGSGMDEDTIPRIFDPFFSTKFTGRGLGLAAVLGIVRGHHGGVSVRSQPGLGTTFELFFPYSHQVLPKDVSKSIRAIPKAETCSQGKAIETQVKLRTPRKPDDPSMVQSADKARVSSDLATILVIDDEEEILKLLSAHLRAGGYEVLCASDGRSGVEVLKANQEQVSLILLDMTMPGMSARETWEKLKECHPGVPIILSSGYDRERALAEFPDKVPFLSKPYSGAFLLEVVGGILEQNGPPPKKNSL
jgi:signal transduction histidine kinase